MTKTNHLFDLPIIAGVQDFEQSEALSIYGRPTFDLDAGDPGPTLRWLRTFGCGLDMLIQYDVLKRVLGFVVAVPDIAHLKSHITVSETRLVLPSVQAIADYRTLVAKLFPDTLSAWDDLDCFAVVNNLDSTQFATATFLGATCIASRLNMESSPGNYSVVKVVE